MVDDDQSILCNRLVEALRAAGAIGSEPVEAAFRAVPRHLFLPELERERAYLDEAFPIKWDADGRPISSSSQPAIMAIMLEQLSLAAGQRVLEVGTGTGYNAALLADLVGEGGEIVSIDLDAELADRARSRLAATGAGRVIVACGDAAVGYPERAPYDRIIVTAGAWDLAPAWLGQLAPGGRLVVPLSLGAVQASVAFERADGHLDAVSVRGCGFMRLRGALGGPERTYPLGAGSGVFLELDDERALDLPALGAALAEPGEDLPTGVSVRPAGAFDGLGLWLGLREPDLARLSAIGAAARRALVPALISFPEATATAALLAEKSMAALVRVGDEAAGKEVFELGVRPLGAAADEIARRLVARVRSWHDAGRPGTAELRIAAYPREGSPDVAAETIIERPHFRLLLAWGD